MQPAAGLAKKKAFNSREGSHTKSAYAYLRRLREMVKWWDCPLGMDIRVHRKVDRLSYVGKMAVLVDTQGVP